MVSYLCHTSCIHQIESSESTIRSSRVSLFIGYPQHHSSDARRDTIDHEDDGIMHPHVSHFLTRVIQTTVVA
jgi:hypothetical protein